MPVNVNYFLYTTVRAYVSQKSETPGNSGKVEHTPSDFIFHPVQMNLVCLCAPPLKDTMDDHLDRQDKVFLWDDNVKAVQQ
jgi:hypothetical protein